ncbi:MAG: methyltransferase domain-containing protein [Betaproteobacteria bacterium]|nr:methyltransferase domain-containing protein [Betaproteobacteria bacterium]
MGDGNLYQDFNGVKGTYMLNFDLRGGIPAEDNSLDLIYHCHMLEHLSYLEGIKFTKECFRVLAPGGRMRIVVPDLELWINAYRDKNRFFFEEYRKVLDPNLHVTNGAIFMGMLHGHEHKCGYDHETLAWMLQASGFSQLERKLYADSAIEGISMMEPQHPLRTMESLCIECVKPR